MNNTKSKVLIVILGLIIWEVLIYFFAVQASSADTLKYQLAARYSARTSFVFLLMILTWTGYQGLVTIYSKDNLRKLFLLMIIALTANHILHFIFIVLNYNANDLNLLDLKNLPGALGYMLLATAPLYLWNKKRLSSSLHWQIHLFFMVIVTIFLVIYVSRISKPVMLSSPVLVYQLSLGVMVIAVIMNVYRFFSDRLKLS